MRAAISAIFSTNSVACRAPGVLCAPLRSACCVATIGVTIEEPRFEWDEAKNRSNVRKHGFDFAWAEQTFRNPLFVRPDTREDYGEERWIGIGMIQGRCVFVAFAEPAPDTIRIISLRKTTHEERKEYEEAIQDRLGAD
jgi:uncharacterized DUF497 family protein